MLIFLEVRWTIYGRYELIGAWVFISTVGEDPRVFILDGHLGLAVLALAL